MTRTGITMRTRMPIHMTTVTTTTQVMTTTPMTMRGLPLCLMAAVTT
jgi:hypothetical protein